MLVINGVEDLRSRAGQELGVSPWRAIAEQDLRRFAAVVGEAATADLYVLSLAPSLAAEVYEIRDVGFILNYGTDEVRFLSTEAAGSRVRMRVLLSRVQDVAGGVLIATTCTFEVDGRDDPACVVDRLAVVRPRAVVPADSTRASDVARA